jgi:integrase
VFLNALVDPYIAIKNKERPIGHELSDATKIHLLDCVSAFSKWLGHRATINDLWSRAFVEDRADNRRDFGDFLASIISSGQSPWTAKNRRTGLLILWRFAKRMGYVSTGPDAVRRVHCPQLHPNGFSLAQARVILAGMENLKGVVRLTGIRKAIYWPSLMRTKWDHGFRAGDMPRIKISDFDPLGWLFVLEHKTRKSGWYRVRPHTADAIKACISIDSKREFIWPGYKPKGLCKAFGRIVERLGMDGSAQWVRRGSSSEVDKLFPGNGWRFLRHSSPQVFEQHYRVSKIVDDDAPAPPEL